MRLKRFLKSLINNIVFIINAILWIFNIKSLGEMAVGIEVGKTRKEKLIYGLCSFLQYITYATIVGLIITIYWWWKGETSIAEKISGLHMSGGK